MPRVGISGLEENLPGPRGPPRLQKLLCHPGLLAPSLGVEALAVMGWGSYLGNRQKKAQSQVWGPCSPQLRLCIYPEPPPSGRMHCKKEEQAWELFLGREQIPHPPCSTLSPSCGEHACFRFKFSLNRCCIPKKPALFLKPRRKISALKGYFLPRRLSGGVLAEIKTQGPGCLSPGIYEIFH